MQGERGLKDGEEQMAGGVKDGIEMCLKNKKSKKKNNPPVCLWDFKM